MEQPKITTNGMTRKDEDAQVAEMEWVKTICNGGCGRLLAQLPNCIQKLEKKLEEKKYDILCFVGQDSYRLYNLVCKYILQEESHSKECKIIRSRDLIQNSYANEFAGKTAVIFDITIYEGYEIFDCFCRLKKSGVTEVVQYSYALSTESLSANFVNKMKYQIFCNVFDISDINADNKTKVEDLWEEYIRGIVCYRYFQEKLLCNINIELFKVFHHEEAYSKFREKKWNCCSKGKIPEFIRYVILRFAHDKVISIEELKNRVREKIDWIQKDELDQIITDVLQVMRELDMVTDVGTTTTSMLQYGKNIAWIEGLEGRLCFYWLYALYIESIFNTKGLLDQIKEVFTEEKKFCSEWHHYPYILSFDEFIFDYYVEWYANMGEDDFEYYVSSAQNFLRCEEIMGPLEFCFYADVRLAAKKILSRLGI